MSYLRVHKQVTSIRSNKGMVSIMTTMILMIIISLIVMGFAQLSRRNQRQTLDRQLSTQAFYAAESGVNDVRKRIQTAIANDEVVPDKTGCTDPGPLNFYSVSKGVDPDIDPAHNIKYTCLLVDASPDKLRYSNVGNPSLVIPVISANNDAISKINFTVQPKSSGPLANCPTTDPPLNQFTPATSWNCGYGVLRVDVVPTSNSMSLDSLRNATMTFFMVPLKPPAGTPAKSIAYAAGASNANNLVGVQCTDTDCQFSITGLSQSSYYLRVSSLYKNVSLQLTGTDAGGTLEFANAQAVIDVTGKAEDVLKRIQVNVPVQSNSQNQLSDYALQTTDSLCKRFAVMENMPPAKSGSVPGSASRLCQ